MEFRDNRGRFTSEKSEKKWENTAEQWPRLLWEGCRVGRLVWKGRMSLVRHRFIILKTSTLLFEMLGQNASRNRCRKSPMFTYNSLFRFCRTNTFSVPTTTTTTTISHNQHARKKMYFLKPLDFERAKTVNIFCKFFASKLKLKQ